MGSISLLQWRKAYMLEFLVDGKVEECFTFSVPPESEEFQFPQRITETKTFGGSVFDDYGNDSYRITLSGTTVNEDKKFIYRGKTKAPKYLTGTKEIFELQNIIKNWADDNVTTGFFKKVTGSLSGGEKTVYLYDLSKMSLLQLATGVASRNYWRVFIKDLKIKRDKSKPKTYNYTLEMTAVEDEKKRHNGLLSSLADVVDGISDVVDGITAVMDLVEATTEAAAKVADCCAKVKSAYEMMKNRDMSASLVALTVVSGLDIVSRVIGGDSNTFYNCTRNLLHSAEVFGGLAKDNSETAQKGKIQQTSSFVVSFNSNGGTGIHNQSVEYSKTVTKPSAPTKDDYSFAGWYSDSALTEEYDFEQEVTSNLTLYAKWTLVIATVTFNSRNGSQVTPQKVEVGSRATMPTAPTRSGYAFDKWYIDYACEQAFDFATVITDSITLYAGWTKTYNIVFNSNGGSSVNTQTVTTGGLAVYPKTPTKENFTFAYWCTDAELRNVFDFSTSVTSDITLYACWIQISNTVTFNSLGGSAVTSQKVPIGGYASKPNNPTREGFDFIYWATDQAGTNEFRFASTPINANTTLYAKWAEHICKVSFDTNGGSEIDVQEVGYGNRVIFPAIPTKEGSSFEMWQTRKDVVADSDAETEYQYEEFDFNTEIKEDITLYALWFGGKQ